MTIDGGLSVMSPFVARCLLVGAAMVLAVVGVVVPLSGVPRATVLVAAAWCAALDVVLVRSSRGAGSAGSAGDAVVLGPPAPSPGAHGSTTAQRSPPVPLVRRSVTLGTGRDGRTVDVVIDGRPMHLVVVGVGVLAHAVFRALAVQVSEVSADADADAGVVARCAAALDLRDLVTWHPSGAEPVRCPRLPDDTAALVVDPAGRAPLTLVLVPGLRQLPRRWDVAVEVTRYGCTTRRHHESRGTAIAPALPQLEPPATAPATATATAPAPAPATATATAPSTLLA
ncbi:hypothetical protein DEJ28_10365 [Curtobacterium sp. MCPF17_002]|uniref:hypothetical protein n=1 Tax=Curtobacterium sp. MCPF17_002 TaxID=2175645 RepID=UPI000DA757C0|nr:hypothetical protein [Curtobacterium sp. MCPF17_002]WIB76082.1 hypothetical protein DEJ28_10365 [Curtobacterium sp. MCPF17_002]